MIFRQKQNMYQILKMLKVRWGLVAYVGAARRRMLPIKFLHFEILYSYLTRLSAENRGCSIRPRHCTRPSTYAGFTPSRSDHFWCMRFWRRRSVSLTTKLIICPSSPTPSSSTTTDCHSTCTARWGASVLKIFLRGKIFLNGVHYRCSLPNSLVHVIANFFQAIFELSS